MKQFIILLLFPLFIQGQSIINTSITSNSILTQENYSKLKVKPGSAKKLVKSYCAKLAGYFKKYKWTKTPCGNLKWQVFSKTQSGNPLIYIVFGTGKDTTLLLSGVHPDELTPIPMGFKLANYLTKNPQKFNAKKNRVIIAPLVNPDGFFRKKPTRMNGNGVDLNRNFFTLDWYGKAIKFWQGYRHKNPRHFPGFFPNSEVETMFQIALIDKYNPDKILSIHSPLGFLDYDGPGDQKKTLNNIAEQKARKLIQAISKKTNNYKIVDYSFFPGSLGNYAGNERHIPTVTLELETTNTNMVNRYWKKFLPGILQSINYPYKISKKSYINSQRTKKVANASQFSLLYEF